jgi:hypothetical protein
VKKVLACGVGEDADQFRCVGSMHLVSSQ